MSAVDLYAASQRDYNGGQLDLALQEFADYLKYFDKGAFASNAQYYIGMVHYAKQDYETATKDFDMVLEHYPDTANKNADARYFKGMSLLRSRQADRSRRARIPRPDRFTIAAIP